MESLGLVPSSTGAPGGKKTGQKMNDYPLKNGIFEKVLRRMHLATQMHKHLAS